MSLEHILPIARGLAGRAEGMTNGELATAANLTASAAGAYIASYVKGGHLFKGKREGTHGRYFANAHEANRYTQGTAPVQSAAPDVIARAAVAHMRQGQVQSSLNLAALCHVTATVIDQALAPLADAKKLVRVSVRRGDVDMFDYRFSAAWKPQAADFDLCTGQTEVPKASVSPVAPAAQPKAKPLPAPSLVAPAAPAAPVAAPSAPAAPSPAPGTMSAAPRPIVVAKVETSFGTVPPVLGWEAIKPRALVTTDPQDSFAGSAFEDEPEIFTVEGDLVCALNSRGELAIDMGKSGILQFKANEALIIKRFLENTSVLEELAGRAAV